MASLHLPAKTGAALALSRRPGNKKKRKPPRLSHLHKPGELTLEQWQAELRKQFGREQDFLLKNLGEQPVFSEFQVANPKSGNSYRVTIRGNGPADNACSCPDFATNTLGTCKHIEFTLARLARRGGAKLLRAGYHPPYSEVFLQYGSRRDVRFRPGTDCPVELARLASRYFDAEGLLRVERVLAFEDFLKEAGRLDAELRCGDDVLAFVAELRDVTRRQELVAKMFPRGIHSAAFKNLLRVPLYDYQREGALFAARAGRCLIGDEMGLGKTVQAIAAAEIMARLFGVERVLIVCPTSLKHQWQREIGKFIHRPAGVIGGLRPQREADVAAPEPFFKIMNYDTVHADLDLIERWAPDLVILDEAQRIKNWSTRVARSVKRIRSPYAVVLTGTPLENRLEELISIVQFVDRYRLGPTFRLLHDHQIRDEHGKVIGYQNLDRIGQTLEPILIRRQKDQVLDQLPERIDTNVFVPMLPEQMAHHEENRENVARVVQRWRKYKFLSEADQRRLMIGLQNMRMSCDSTYLLDQETDVGRKADEATMLLDELLERPDAKVVIFSQWLRMHELLTRRLDPKRLGYVLFHGGVPGNKRGDLVQRFRDEPKCRAFLSTDAGGVGLNLQHASIVFNMDLPWNPAVLEQRIGRVHRLGQRQPVRVVNFVARGTIEEGMLSVLSFKKSLFSGVLDGGTKDVFLGGSRLTKFIESVEAATGSIPADVVAESPPEPADALPARGPRRPARDGDGDEAPRRQAAARARESSAAANPWGSLLQAGMKLVQQLAEAQRPAGRSGNGQTSALPPTVRVARDAETGEDYVRLPLPPPQVLDQALQAFGKLLEAMR
jgi:superfamily II DNA or RNA helicase